MVGESVGYVVGSFLIPVIGLLLLILGIWRYRVVQAQQVSRRWLPPGQVPATRSKSIGGPVTMIVAGGVFFVLGLAGAALTALGASTVSVPAAALQVGQCITDQSYSSADMSPTPADCAERDAVYELAHEGNGPAATCPDGQREDSGYAVLFNSSRTLCFVLNVNEGECFRVDPDAQLFTPVDCTDPTATSRIDRIIKGQSDLSLCPAGAQGAVFPEPKSTYCVVPPT
ncbi:MAG: hypothetical protein WBB07_10845 [Mycobacterium sp.]